MAFELLGVAGFEPAGLFVPKPTRDVIYHRTYTAVVVRDLGRVVAGHGRRSREGITLAWHGSDMDRYTGKLARLP